MEDVNEWYWKYELHIIRLDFVNGLIPFETTLKVINISSEDFNYLSHNMDNVSICLRLIQIFNYNNFILSDKDNAKLMSFNFGTCSLLRRDGRDHASKFYIYL